MFRICSLGGGTGHSAIAEAQSGLKVHKSHVVSVADKGGSSGKVRVKFGPHGAHLPPGDINKLIVASSVLPASERQVLVEALFTRFNLNYRFTGARKLKCHYAANLLMPALTMACGSSLTAIEAMCQIFRAESRIIPVTLANIHLHAVLENGVRIHGEDRIDARRVHLSSPIAGVYLKPRGMISDQAKQAIEKADLIIISSGDLYTSLMPCLLVDGVPEAIRNATAKLLHTVNLMTKHNETDGYKASNFVMVIERQIGRKFDYVLVNDDSQIARGVLREYQSEHAFPVRFDQGFDWSGRSVTVMEVALFNGVVRHDPNKVSAYLEVLISKIEEE